MFGSMVSGIDVLSNLESGYQVVCFPHGSTEDIVVWLGLY